MHGRLHEEDVLQQLAGDRGVQRRAAAQHLVEQNLPLKHNEHTRAGLGHLRAGQHRLVDGLFQLRGLLLRRQYPQKPDVPAAQLLQPSAQLRLKHDEQRQNAPFHHIAHNIVDPPQVQQGRKPQRQNKDHDTLENILGAGTAHQAQQLIDRKGHNGDVQHIRDPNQRQVSPSILQHRNDRIHSLLLSCTIKCHR